MLKKQGKTHILILGKLTYAIVQGQLKDADAPQEAEHQQDARQPQFKDR